MQKEVADWPGHPGGGRGLAGLGLLARRPHFVSAPRTARRFGLSIPAPPTSICTARCRFRQPSAARSRWRRRPRARLEVRVFRAGLVTLNGVALGRMASRPGTGSKVGAVGGQPAAARRG